MGKCGPNQINLNVSFSFIVSSLQVKLIMFFSACTQYSLLIPHNTYWGTDGPLGKSWDLNGKGLP